MDQSIWKFLLFAPVVLVAKPSPARTEIPSDEKVLSQIGQPLSSELPTRFRMLVWNIHKAEDGQAWQRDFHHLASNNDVILLQEGYQTATYTDVIGQVAGKMWSFATSFVYKGYNTGVATGSSSRPVNTRWLRSPGREPLVNSPKMAIISEFQVAESEHNLLIANIHGINFVTNGTFYEHVAQVITVIEKHQGPVVFAGDFNTWNSSRMEYLRTRCHQLGLSMISFKNESRTLALDHVFYRGLVPHKSEILSAIETSDHLPLAVEFSLEEPTKVTASALRKAHLKAL